MKKDSYIEGHGINSVSRLPNWLIKLTGWLDSHKSPDVAVAHLNTYLATLAANEKNEALLAEKVLKTTREKGNKCLYTVVHTNVDAAPTPHESGSSPTAKRAYSVALAKHNASTTNLTGAKKALTEIDATIISGNLVFEERLEKTRNQGMRQINVYIKGVRSGKQHNFNPEIIPDDTARIKYYAAHKETDDLIHKLAKEAQ